MSSCLYFSGILRGLVSLHCQLHLAPVHGPKDEIQPEPSPGASPGEQDRHAATLGFRGLTVGLWWGLGAASVTAHLTTRMMKALLAHGCVDWRILPAEVRTFTPRSAVGSQ